jgi:hypothetical protein
MNAEIEPIRRLIVAYAIADLRPLEDTLEDHEDIRSGYAKPEDVLLPCITYA